MSDPFQQIKEEHPEWHKLLMEVLCNCNQQLEHRGPK